MPEQWEGQVDGHNFYFRERGGDWDIELDLHEKQPGTTKKNLIATGTLTAHGYGQSPRERAALIVTTIRNHLRHRRTAEATGSTDYAYRVEWSPADNQFVALVAEFPSPSWLAPAEDEALRGMIQVVEQIAADDHNTGGGGLRLPRRASTWGCWDSRRSASSITASLSATGCAMSGAAGDRAAVPPA